MNSFYWMVKREFWEHKGGFFWAPIITGAIFLVLNVMGIITAEVIGARHGIDFSSAQGVRHIVENMNAGDMTKVGFGLDMAMYSSTALIAVVLGFVVFFYCLGALYDDRRDRSILFWKSLPLSDTGTVLSKVVGATVLAPTIAVAAGLVAGLLQLVILAIVLSFHGINVWQLLTLAHPFRVIANLISYIPVYLLWSLPSVGWLMFCSAWARSKPFLWAIALPVATGLVVSWFGLMGLFNRGAGWFWTNIVVRGLFSVFPGSSAPTAIANGGASGVSFANGDPGALFLDHTWQLLASPQLWIGCVVGLALLAGAVWFRRVRDDS